MTDLADRISRGAVAALDLAPFDDRFTKLSRLVLTGGASRFIAAVNPDEPLDYLVPVGLPHERIEYGALTVQRSQLGLVWRDAAAQDHTRVVQLDPANPARYSTLELGGESWTRFDLTSGEDAFAFLVPPVSSPKLTRTLVTVLQATPESTEAPPPPAASPAPTPRPDPGSPAAPPMPLFRDEAPTAAPPASPAPATQPPEPVPASPAPKVQVSPPPPSSPTSLPAETVPTPEPSLTLRGFFIGLLASLAVGAVVIIVTLLI
ncbi:MAG: hypothetical protein ACK5LN_05500 [Propioniciclava sp.]